MATRAPLKVTETPVDIVAHWELEDNKDYTVQCDGNNVHIHVADDAPANIRAAGRTTLYHTGTWYKRGIPYPDRLIVTPVEQCPIWVYVFGDEPAYLNCTEA